MAYNILIVDDSKIIRSVIKKTLTIAEVPVNGFYEAGNGQEGLQIMSDNWIDLVFADINMPVMTGIEMIEKMAADDQFTKIPVIVVSTEGSKTRIEELVQKGAKAYVRKPFTPEVLKSVVSEVMGDYDEK